MERQIRKHQNTLIVIGTGILLFTLWSVIKTIASFNMHIAGLYSSPAEGFVIMFILVILLGVDTLLRVFTALKARSAGYKKNGKISYIFTAIILILIHITAIVYYLMNFSASVDSVIDTVVTCVIEGTGIVMTLDLIYSGIRLKKLLSSKREAGESV